MLSIDGDCFTSLVDPRRISSIDMTRLGWTTSLRKQPNWGKDDQVIQIRNISDAILARVGDA